MQEIVKEKTPNIKQKIIRNNKKRKISIDQSNFLVEAKWNIKSKTTNHLP